MTTFDTNNQVSGIYAAQPFSGKVTDVTVVGEVTYLTIQLDAPIEVWAKAHFRLSTWKLIAMA